MISKKVLICEYKGHIQGYGFLSEPYTEKQLWDTIASAIPQDYSYVHHIIESEFVENPIVEKYRPKFSGATEIPIGTQSFYVVIYMQYNEIRIKQLTGVGPM